MPCNEVYKGFKSLNTMKTFIIGAEIEAIDRNIFENLSGSTFRNQHHLENEINELISGGLWDYWPLSLFLTMLNTDEIGVDTYYFVNVEVRDN